jgi:hypothetical protein
MSDVIWKIFGSIYALSIAVFLTCFMALMSGLTQRFVRRIENVFKWSFGTFMALNLAAALVTIWMPK